LVTDASSCLNHPIRFYTKSEFPKLTPF
jgi:hypothetical protein